ncbi:MAG: hypothetical protein ACYC5Y_12660 [Symbiobacteriia bacterium]
MLLVLLFLLPLLTLDAIQIEGRFEDQIEDELQADQDLAHAIAAAFAKHLHPGGPAGHHRLLGFHRRAALPAWHPHQP